jgi:hypothetical protein
MLYNGIPSARVRDHCETITVVNRASAAQDVADPCGDAKQRCSWRKSLSVTREVLGYWRARSTERYAHLADDPIRAAADRAAGRIAAALTPTSDDAAGGGELAALPVRARHR